MSVITSNVRAVDVDAVGYLARTLGKFAYIELTDEERSAAYQLASLLPFSATVKDFMVACTESGAIKINAPSALMEQLKPLASRLQSSISYAGQFPALCERKD